jgi:hypothetical protein
MSAPFVPALDTFAGGQMTDLPAFTTTLNGTELFEIVSGAPQATTDASNAVNYSITALQLAAAVSNLGQKQVVLTQGLYNTSGSPYVVPTSVARVYVYKPTPEPTYIQFGSANAQLIDVLVQDVAGTSDSAGNGIFNTVTASGIANPTITVPFGGFWFRAITSLNLYALGTA